MQHNRYMQQVLLLAKMINETQTRPNPRVASLIVKNEEIIGIGSHLKSGEEHAEIYALNQAKDKAKGATLYVNLEPCAHYGKTPPCVDSIIRSGISEVVIANQDPNPLVAGKGIKKLKEAGINVVENVLADEAYEINKVFFHNIKTMLPYITIKSGISLDAKLCTKNGHSQWITDIDSRKDAHRYRTINDGILVGVNTIITDNPSLTAYLVEDSTKNPIRIILDSSLRTPLSSKVIQDQVAKTIIVTKNSDYELHEKYKQFNVEILVINDMSIQSILSNIYQHNIYSILVEGGEQVFSSFFDAKLVNEIITYISPQLIGSKNAKHFFAGCGFNTLNENIKFKFIEVKQLANDVKLVAQVLT